MTVLRDDTVRATTTAAARAGDGSGDVRDGRWRRNPAVPVPHPFRHQSAI
ncbi:hypothetical protein [Streptomyces sp. NPDC056160]